MVKSFDITFILPYISTQVLAQNIIHDISSNVREAGMFTLTADKTPDVANIEQLAICIRQVNEKRNANEEFIGQ